MAGLLITNYNTAQFLLGGEQFFKDMSYNNATGSPVTLPQGTLMGKVFATGYIIPNVSTAVDGSEQPIGFIAENTTIPANTIQTIQVLVAGDINQNLVILGGSDTFDTTVGTEATGGSIADMIRRNLDINMYPTIGISLGDNPQSF